MSQPTSTPWSSPDLGSAWPPPVLDPAGPYAGSVTTLTWVLFAMAVVVTLVVLAALGVALFGNARHEVAARRRQDDLDRSASPSRRWC